MAQMDREIAETDQGIVVHTEPFGDDRAPGERRIYGICVNGPRAR